MSDISLLSENLRSVISTSWDNGDYSGAVREAFFYMSELIRDKGDCEGDGQQLITAAFGGQDPKIRINLLSSDADRSEQEGFVLLLRGVYLTVRNPRSHEQTRDSASSAYSILAFMDWLLGRIQGSKGTYGQEEFLAAVKDPDFVNTDEYAQALFDRIPQRKRNDFLLALYRTSQQIKTEIMATIFLCYYKHAKEQDIQILVEFLSTELRSTSDDSVRKVILSLLTPQLWQKLDRVAQIRTENRVLSSLSEGTTPAQGKTKAGWLATWCEHLVPAFESKDQVLRAVGIKIFSSDPDQIRYVDRFLTREMWSLFTAESIEEYKNSPTDMFYAFEDFPRYMLSEIIDGQKLYYDLVARNRRLMPEHLWNYFKEAMSSFKEKVADKPPSKFEDDIPF